MQRASRFFACLTLVGMSCWVAAALFAAPPASDNPKGSEHDDRARAAARDRDSSRAARTRGQSPEASLSYRDLVAQGRQAFDRGEYDVAEALARQALAKKRPGPLGRMLAKDSAQKLLRDLEKVQANKKADADRAWAEQEQANADPDAFYSSTGTAQVGDAELKRTVASLIEQAYVQLQQGNNFTAYQLAMRAKGLNVRYAPGEQTPDDVLRAIAASERRETLGAPQLVNPVADADTIDYAAAAVPGDNEGAPEPVEVQTGGTTRSSTAFPVEISAGGQSPASAPLPSAGDGAGELIEQARRAMAHGQFDEARSLAQQAKLHRYAPASPRGDSPDTILHQIDEFRRIVNEGKSGFDRDYVLRQQNDWLLELAGRLRDQGDLDLAAGIVRQALDLKIPAGPGAMTASRMRAEIEQQRQGSEPSVGAVAPSGHGSPPGGYEQATYPDRAAEPLPGSSEPPSVPPALSSSAPRSWGPTTPDPSQIGAAQSAPSAAERARAAQAETDLSDAHRQYELGVQAMRRGDHAEAIAHLQEALQSPTVEPQLKQRIQDHLSGLYAQSARREPGPVQQAGHQDPLAESAVPGQLRADRVEAEATQALIEANRLQKEKPDEALAKLNQAKTQLTAAGRQQPRLLQLLRRVNERIADIEAYKEQNAAGLELREQNRVTEEQIRREQENEIAVQKELAELVDQFNQLIDDGRFAEAEKVAEKAKAIAPDEPVTQSMVLRGRMRSNIERDIDQQNRAARAFEDRMFEAQGSRIANVGDENPMVFPENWEDLIKIRKAGEARYSTRTEAEQQIEQALRTKVTVKYDGTPLVTVLEDLAKQAGINLVIDQQAFVDQDINSDTPVKIDVDGIMLKSALKIILDDVHLIYVIRDEVLKITSESRGRGELVPVVYPVGDLVLPIPNFVPGGAPLGTMLKEAMLGGTSPLAGSPLAMATPINNGPSDLPRVNQNILAQLGGGAMAGPGGGVPSSAGFGAVGQPPFGSPGEMIAHAGGAANADFDSLMDLIKETIEPESWDDVGGPGSMEPFPLNLALIISQTEEVHDRIASLLEQLRRLLDLQLAVEVRFVTLTDNFFERIGIDFDFDIDDDQDKPFQVFGQPDPNFQPVFSVPSTEDPEADNPGRNVQDRDHLNGVAVGQSAPGIFSVDLDIPFRQNSFSLGVPTFGGFTADAGAQMGFAILSDIEAYFFINAAQADRRTNIVQAPKVVMFNGQSGIVADFSQRPFLIGVIPIIGAGSVGFTPIIQPILSGAIVSVQGIISADRRYVRLTVLPIFIQLGEVFTITTNLGAVGGGGGLIGGGGAAATVPVTLQLPSTAQTFVITTVNVPDGGTVLLGGVKRVNEGRTEAGVPVLNKLPYVNRLFKNVGTGRETQSLMLMVTPRIIIGEEEESLLGVSS